MTWIANQITSTMMMINAKTANSIVICLSEISTNTATPTATARATSANAKRAGSVG